MERGNVHGACRAGAVALMFLFSLSVAMRGEAQSPGQAAEGLRAWGLSQVEAGGPARKGVTAGCPAPFPAWQG